MRTDGPIYASGIVRNGRLKIRQSDVLGAQLAELRDGVVEIEVRRKRATRSLAANAYYFAVVLQMLADHTGYSVDEMHEICKAKFLPKRLAIADGNGEIQGEFVIGGTTTRLSKAEFYDYCESIREWAADELGVVIPDPH